MVEMRRARTRMKSLRSLIAIGGAAAMALGVAQATGTLAVSTDAVNSTGAQVATGNFYPTKLTDGPVSCWYEAPWYDTVTGRRVTISWPAVTGVTGYKVVFVRKSDPDFIVRVDDLLASQTSISGITHGSQNVMYARVYTVNGPVVSSGYRTSVEITHKDLVSNRTECQGGTGPELANQDWENTKTWDPTTPDPNGSAARGMAPQAMEMDTEGLTAEPEVKDTTTQTPTSSTQNPTTNPTTEAPATTPTTETPTTTTTESATPTTTTTVVPTTTTTTMPVKAPVVALSIPEVSASGATATLVQTDTGAAVVVADSAGDEISSTPVSSSAELKWDSDGQLWIVDGVTIYQVSSSGTATTVTAADAPADIAAWIDGLQ